MTDPIIFISCPIGTDGRDSVSINVEQIASYQSHVVTSYSYVDYTLVTLHNGIQHDCRISKANFELLLADAVNR